MTSDIVVHPGRSKGPQVNQKHRLRVFVLGTADTAGHNVIFDIVPQCPATGSSAQWALAGISGMGTRAPNEPSRIYHNNREGFYISDTIQTLC